ncbi:MAG TPA: hypothetical protein VJ550_00085 [Geomonas sp.]|nr:hypothetical protein [Geomonas sp.]
MNTPLTKPKLERSPYPSIMPSFTTTCLLLAASVLAIAGGVATSILFFGMLLVFSLLLYTLRDRTLAKDQTPPPQP